MQRTIDMEIPASVSYFVVLFNRASRNIVESSETSSDDEIARLEKQIKDIESYLTTKRPMQMMAIEEMEMYVSFQYRSVVFHSTKYINRKLHKF